MGIRIKKSQESYDVVIIGGGMTGLCAAIASARGGARTALVHDRPVLGGNASSEIRMHICGASSNLIKRDAEETGILHEILLENKSCNDYYNYSIWDNVLLQKAYAEKNLKLYLNTTVNDVCVEGDRIVSVSGYQLTTEIHWTFEAKIFMDCTGNGTIGYMAGVDYRIGSECRAEFDEPDAPEEPNNNRMGNTLLFKAIDRQEPVTFRSPEWARKFTEEDLKNRGHGNYQSTMHFAEDMEGSTEGNAAKDSKGKKAFDCYGLDYGYWWIELPGKEEDIISEYETIRDELVRCVYGVWDHLKNGGDHGAENFDLQWVGMLPGVRESRRLEGDYILTENDIFANRVFPDAVAYGGWPVDNHTPGGLNDKDELPSFIHHFPGLYTIPYRSYCNKNIANLMQAGRILSATKLGMASSRVMGTCAVGGQAAGTAAAMCIHDGCDPRELGGNITKLQQQLMRDDCFIPGFRNEDPADLARGAAVSASSEAADSPAANVINGMARNAGTEINCWESDGLAEGGETVTLKLEKAAKVGQVRLTFDSNLNKMIKITLSAKRIASQRIGVPPELVKDYEVILYHEGREVARRTVSGNYQRLNVVDFPEACLCDRIEIRVLSTNGYPNAKIFEIRAYEQ